MAAIALVGNMIAPGGGPASGCKLNSYLRNTTTRSPLYSNVGLTTPTTNPYVGDADGRLEFYFDSAIEYEWSVTTSDGATVIWEADVVGGVISVTYADGVLIHSTWAPALATSLGSGWTAAFAATKPTTVSGYGITDGVRVVATKALLKAVSISGLASSYAVQVLGRSSAGGDGGGLFRWLPGSQTAFVALDPGEAIYVAPDSDPTGASGVWVRIIDVGTYQAGWSATGDGATNDRVALQSLHDAGNAGGQIIELGPNKTYEVVESGSNGYCLNYTKPVSILGQGFFSAITPDSGVGAAVSTLRITPTASVVNWLQRFEKLLIGDPNNSSRYGGVGIDIDTRHSTQAAFWNFKQIIIFEGNDVGFRFRNSTPTTLVNNPITTANTLNTVTIAHVAHGFSVNQYVEFSGATAVGGLTVSGTYLVASTPTADTYTITHASTASSTATGGGAAVVESHSKNITGGLYCSTVEQVISRGGFLFLDVGDSFAFNTILTTGGGIGFEWQSIQSPDAEMPSQCLIQNWNCTSEDGALLVHRAQHMHVENANIEAIVAGPTYILDFKGDKGRNRNCSVSNTHIGVYPGVGASAIFRVKNCIGFEVDNVICLVGHASTSATVDVFIDTDSVDTYVGKITSNRSGGALITDNGVGTRGVRKLATLTASSVWNNKGAARGSISFSGLPVAADTITVNSTVFTARASGATGNEFNIGVDATATAAAFTTVLNASVVAGVALATYYSIAGDIYVLYDASGTAGNSFTLAESATNTTISGAVLTGGDVTSEDASFTKDYDGFVTLEGSIKSGDPSASVVILTMPVGFRPEKRERFSVYCNNSGTHTVALLEIREDGQLVIVSCPGNTELSLSGIQYRCADINSISFT